MAGSTPNLILLAGPNGAGKTTAAQVVLRGALKVYDFVNADLIAQGISPFNPESAAISAGRMMLARLHELTGLRLNVAFESTLASRSFAPWIRTLTENGYEFRLLFFWLPSSDQAIQRVYERVEKGGHFVPEDVVRRRYEAGLRNFFQIYMPLATSWVFYDNGDDSPRKVAEGGVRIPTDVFDAELWNNLRERWL